MSNDAPKRAIRDDILWGGQAIADEIGRTLQEIYGLIRTNKIHVTHLGPKTIITTKRQLRRDLGLDLD
jgi:hypothetical protein